LAVVEEPESEDDSMSLEEFEAAAAAKRAENSIFAVKSKRVVATDFEGAALKGREELVDESAGLNRNLRKKNSQKKKTLVLDLKVSVTSEGAGAFMAGTKGASKAAERPAESSSDGKGKGGKGKGGKGDAKGKGKGKGEKGASKGGKGMGRGGKGSANLNTADASAFPSLA